MIKCLDCGKKLGENAKYLKSVRCHSCAKKGSLNHQWKDGSRTLLPRNNYLRQWRHKKGLSKRFVSKYGGKVFTKKEHRQRRKALMKGGGDLPIERIQMVYEDNIKKFGTLTCVYCLKSILFGQDSLEHKLPLSRKGTNEYKNLGIACKKCNSKKGNKTEKEFRECQKSVGIVSVLTTK